MCQALSSAPEMPWEEKQTSGSQSECPSLIKTQPRTREGATRASRVPGWNCSTHASNHWVQPALAHDLGTLAYTWYKPGAQTRVAQKQAMIRGCHDCCWQGGRSETSLMVVSGRGTGWQKTLGKPNQCHTARCLGHSAQRQTVCPRYCSEVAAVQSLTLMTHDAGSQRLLTSTIYSLGSLWTQYSLTGRSFLAHFRVWQTPIHDSKPNSKVFPYPSILSGSDSPSRRECSHSSLSRCRTHSPNCNPAACKVSSPLLSPPQCKRWLGWGLVSLCVSVHPIDCGALQGRGPRAQHMVGLQDSRRFGKVMQKKKGFAVRACWRLSLPFPE